MKGQKLISSSKMIPKYISFTEQQTQPSLKYHAKTESKIFAILYGKPSHRVKKGFLETRSKMFLPSTFKQRLPLCASEVNSGNPGGS